MKLLLGIVYFDRPDLLRLAVNSIKDVWSLAFILDNSDSGHVYSKPAEWPIPIKRIEEVAPLSFSQNMHFIHHTACQNGCNAWMFMHANVEPQQSTPQKMLAILDSAIISNRNWGAAYARYATMVAFSVKAVNMTGSWDPMLPQYYSDNDYFRRLRLAGYEIIDTDLDVVHRIDSSTPTRADQGRAFKSSITCRLYREYYRDKWGGSPGREVYTKPFNNDLGLIDGGFMC